MAANSINASHIVSKSLTADKLSISNLAAISANLGKVTAGTITGTTIIGNSISGGSVTGTTVSGSTINGGAIKGSVIEGGTIKGARIEGITIEAQNIIGDVAKMYTIRTPRQNIGHSKVYSFTLEPSKRKRTVVMFPVLMNLYSEGDGHAGVTNDILLNDKLMPVRYEHFDIKRSSGVMTSTFDVPANQRSTITVRLRKVNLRDNDLAEERTFSFFVSFS